LFVATRPAFQDFDMRFDIVLVAPYRWPQHIVDAWQT
jgi:Holliday junction resolvase-like predicted endonuclease